MSPFTIYVLRSCLCWERNFENESHSTKTTIQDDKNENDDDDDNQQAKHGEKIQGKERKERRNNTLTHLSPHQGEHSSSSSSSSSSLGRRAQSNSLHLKSISTKQR
ncbi:hypothetical protein M0804_014506 [Polistes exclamans]|nr:hypothetical protein M0804_014506 [Polistes exclamans]